MAKSPDEPQGAPAGPVPAPASEGALEASAPARDGEPAGGQGAPPTADASPAPAGPDLPAAAGEEPAPATRSGAEAAAPRPVEAPPPAAEAPVGDATAHPAPAPAAAGGRAAAGPADDEPWRELRVFDNPSLGRAARYTFGEKRLARAVFINALLLVVALAAVQELFGRGLALASERVSFGRIAFLGLVLVETAVISLLAPLGALGLFEAERREECFDQVVASGASPHRVVFGRLLATLAFLGVVLVSSLPFFATMVVLDGATPGQVATTYLVLAAYGACVATMAIACAVAIDDSAMPPLIATLGLVVVLVSGFSRFAPGVFAAWSPLRHVTLGLADVAADLRLGTFSEPAPFGVPVPCALLSLALYLVLGLISAAYAFVGPDLELTRGLDAFDSVAVSAKQEATRARRGVARALLRAIQLRFFYENVGPRAAAWAPLIRALATLAIFCGAHVVFLGALWPSKTPTAFGDIDTRLVYPYAGFTALSVTLLAIAGGGARAALHARHGVGLGPLRVSRFVALFFIVGAGLAFPAALWATATAATGFPREVMLAPAAAGLWALCAGYAAFVFVLSLLFAMATTNPYTATGWSLVALAGLNLLPSLWIPLFNGNVLGKESAALLDLSPLSALAAVVAPDDTIAFTRYEGEEVVLYEHTPRWRPFALVHGALGAGLLGGALALAARERRRAATPDPGPDAPGPTAGGAA